MYFFIFKLYTRVAREAVGLAMAAEVMLLVCQINIGLHRPRSKKRLKTSYCNSPGNMQMGTSMSVKQVREGVFDVYIRLNQKERIRKRIKCSSMLDALAIETDIRNELGQQKRISPYTINTVAQKYIPWMRNHHSEKTYKEKYRMLLSQILPFFGAVLPDRITSQAIETYKNKRLAGRKIHRQINLELLCLQSLIKWGSEQTPGLCNKLLFKIKPLPYKRQIPYVANRDEINAIIDHTSDLFHRSLFCAMYEAGLRSDEARRLRPYDINIENGYLRISGKGDKTRIVPLSKRLSILLSDRLKECGKDFVWDNIKSFKTAFTASKRRAGITAKITPHIFRHSFASHNLEAGTDLRSLQEMMGHEDISTTSIYMHTTFRYLKEQIERAF